MLVDCPDCKGEGKIFLFNMEHPCKTCKGTKKVESSEPSTDDYDYYEGLHWVW